MKLLKNTEGNVKMIGAVAGILIMLIVSILVFYNVMVSIDYTDVDSNIGAAHTQEALNASNATMNQAATFFTIAPIVAIVIVAVVILGYVSRIG